MGRVRLMNIWMCGTLPVLYTLLIFLTATVLTSAGCVQDVSNDPQYRCGYQPDRTYVFQQPCILADNGIYPIGDHAAPSNVQGIVTKGTKILITRLIFRYTFEKQEVSPEAFLIDGQFAGRSININAISKERDPGSLTYVWCLNSTFLIPAGVGKGSKMITGKEGK